MPRPRPGGAIASPSANSDWRQQKEAAKVQAQLRESQSRVEAAQAFDESEDFGGGRPNAVDVVKTTVSRGVARYILKCGTPDGRQWLVAKRYSQFFALKDKLRKLSPVIKVTVRLLRTAFCAPF